MDSVFLAVFLPILILCLGGCQGDQTTNSTYSLRPPDFMHMCYKDDLDFSECLRKSVTSITKRAGDGIPELGVAPTDPVFLEKLNIIELVGLRCKLTNIVARGARNITFVKAKGSYKPGKFELLGTVERSLGSVDYELSSTIDFLPFAIRGKGTGTGTDIKFFAECESEFVYRNGVKYLNVKSLDLRIFSYGFASAALWIGDQRMDFVNSIINTPFNMRYIGQIILSGLKPTLISESLNVMNRVYGSVPYDVLVPDHRPVMNATWTNIKQTNFKHDEHNAKELDKDEHGAYERTLSTLLATTNISVTNTPK